MIPSIGNPEDKRTIRNKQKNTVKLQELPFIDGYAGYSKVAGYKSVAFLHTTLTTKYQEEK